MRSFLLFASFFYLSFLQANTLDFDIEAEQQIYYAVHSPVFCNSTILYSFQGKAYPIQVIHNPEREILTAKPFFEKWGFRIVTQQTIIR